MRKLIIILMVITFCFAQTPTSRTPESTDWVKITDTNGRGWDHTLTQVFGASLNPTFGNITVTGAAVGIEINATTIGLDFQGAYSNAAIDLTDITLDYSGAGGPVMIRAGTYDSPVSSSDPHQSGMIRLYGSNDAATDGGTGFYDRGLFAYLRTDKAKGIFPISGLAEVRTTAGDGPTDVMAGQFIAGLHTSGAKLNAGGFGMFGSWNKVYSASGSVADASTVVAPIWLDNQMVGTVTGEEYGIFATTGASVPDAFIGFETTGAGWSNMWYFDETAYDQDPISALGAKSEVNSDKSIKINLNGTIYYIPIFLVTNME